MSKIKNNGKNSFVFYDSFLSAMKHLNDAEFRECVLKIRDYALEGVDEESISPMVNVIMAMAKPNLDSAHKKYMASVENGKKGAEFGKLGGAPKGNQNARKKQPLKQPLDVDVNEDVEVDENEEVNENEKVDVEVDADASSGSTAFQSSFSNSSIGFQEEEIENDSERLEEREENNERNLGFDFKGFEFVAASEEEKEIHINSKSESNNTPPVSPCSEKEAGCSVARTCQQKEPGMDIGEYYERCLARCTSKLVDMRLGKLPKDDSVFWRAVDFYSQLYGVIDRDKATREVSYIVSELMKQSR